MRANKIDCLLRHIDGQRLLLQDREIPFHEEPAVEAGDRRIEPQRVEQHGHAERRPATGDREADAGAPQLRFSARFVNSFCSLTSEPSTSASTREIFRFATIRTSVTLAQSSGLQTRPSRASNSSAAAGPLPPAA